MSRDADLIIVGAGMAGIRRAFHVHPTAGEVAKTVPERGQRG
jgi:thioredoxin reductase